MAAAEEFLQAFVDVNAATTHRLKGGDTGPKPHPGFHKQTVAAGVNRRFDLAMALLLGDQEQGMDLGPAGFDLLDQGDPMAPFQLVAEQHHRGLVLLHQGQAFVFGGGCPQNVVGVFYPTEKGRQQSPAAQAHHDAGVLEHEVAQVGVAPNLIQEWREVQGLGGLAGEIHFGVSQPGGMRRSLLFRAGAPCSQLGDHPPGTDRRQGSAITAVGFGGRNPDLPGGRYCGFVGGC